MTLEDPFFIVKDEVEKALRKTNGLYLHWCEIQKDSSAVSKEELDWITNELRNSVRSIEWDLEDLEETIQIVENNPKKFKITDKEIGNRQLFISSTSKEIQSMKNLMSHNHNQEKIGQNLNSGSNMNSSHSAKYTRLRSPDYDEPTSDFIDTTNDQQQLIINTQDDQLDLLQGSVGNLKSMSKQIGNELEEQSIMLDELSHDVENTDSKLDNTMKRMAKVLHMTNDKRQWMAIVGLVGAMLVVIVLFFVL